MKKALILSATLLLFCLFTACEMQSASNNSSVIATPNKGITSTSTSTSISTSTTTATSSSATFTAETGTTTSINKPISKKSCSTDSKKSNATNVAPKKSIQPAECVHNYVEKLISPTCTKQGYTLHTCKKCGKSYRDRYTAARHEYGKYLCLHCGCPDPSNPFNSLVAWLETNGTLAGNGAYSSIKYEKSGTIYSISTNIYYQNSIAFDFEKGEEIFRITLDDTDQCSIYYYSNRISGDAKLKKSKVCSSFPLNLNSFENNGSVVCSKQEFATQMSSKIDSFMNIIQDKLLYPRTGLKLNNFGFKAY